jgi:hypothetical protein
MALKFEDFFNDIFGSTGITFRKNIATDGNLAVTGTSTFTGAATFTAAPVFTAAATGPQTRATSASAAVGATVVLTAADSGKVLINASTSGSPSWTLPAKANGLYFTFVCGNTTAGFTVTAADAVIHFKTSASGTVLTSTTTLTNTQATAIVGDTISIVCDGTAWWMTAQSGIFAAS